MKQAWIKRLLNVQFLMFIFLVILDQITKWWAYLTQVNWTLIPGFLVLSYTRNTGAAWSILEGQLPLLALISFMAGTAMIVYFFVKSHHLQWYYQWILILIMAGTWGNFVDRAFYEEGVIDFISFQFGTYFFPTFNLADALLTVGIVVLIGVTLMEEYLWKKNPSTLK